ncbi:MAG: zinc ribbon domain-containing protein, partial [Acidimicrobiales bacterium]
LRLLAGERGYVRTEPDEVREGLEREAAAVNPDTSLFRGFPDASVMINRLAAERFLRGDRAYAPPPTDDDLESAPADAPVEEEPRERAAKWEGGGEGTLPPSPFPLPFSMESDTPDQCPYCGGAVPGNRKVNFCPHCGQPPSGELKCPACGSEVDVGWAYCVGCGRATGFE